MIPAETHHSARPGKPSQLLLVSSSSSDLAEFEATARALAAAGHLVTLVYFYAGSSRQVHEASLRRVTELDREVQNLDAYAIDVDKGLEQFQAALNPKEQVRVRTSAQDTSATIVDFRKRVDSLKDDLRTWMRGNGLLFKYHRFLQGVRAVRRLFSRLLMFRVPRVYGLLTGFVLLRIYKYYRQACEEMLAKRPYRAVLVPEDVVGPLWPTLIKTALRRGVPTLILPYTLANQEEAFKSLKDHEQLQTRLNKWAAKLHPRWRLRREGYDIVRMPAGHIHAHHWLGLAPPDPWMMNSGRARLICVDSQASFDYFVKGGIPARKLRITGSVSQDELARQLQGKAAALACLREDLRLMGDKPLLLLSGCPNQLAGQVPHCEFADMAALAAHVGQALQALAQDFHVVVRPHPNYLAFGEMLAPYGVCTSMAPTAQLVPLCDLFVAFASATIRWAAACGIPTINYDVFHYGYSDFDGVGGVVTVVEPDQFIRAVAQMKPGSAAYRVSREAAQAHATRWSVLDGKGLQRLQEAINETQE